MDNAPVTVNNMDTQNRPPKPNRRMPPNSDWSNSESEKDDQARAPIPKTPSQNQQGTSFASYASEATPLRRANTYPKVLTFGRGNIAPLTNRTHAPIGHGQGLNTDQTC